MSDLLELTGCACGHLRRAHGEEPPYYCEHGDCDCLGFEIIIPSVKPVSNTEQKVKWAVDKIIRDLSDRRGLRQEWEQIDEEIQQEIKATWREIIMTAIKETK